MQTFPKASVGQADVQRFEPHLGHNWLSCGVFLVKSRHFGLPLAQTIRPNWQSLSAGGYTNVEYSQSLYLKRRGQLLFQVWAGHNMTLPFPNRIAKLGKINATFGVTSIKKLHAVRLRCRMALRPLALFFCLFKSQGPKLNCDTPF